MGLHVVRRSIALVFEKGIAHCGYYDIDRCDEKMLAPQMNSACTMLTLSSLFDVFRITHHMRPKIKGR